MKISTQNFGSKRLIEVDGRTYEYGTHPYVRAGDDRFYYILPNGESYCHPTREGCLLMILKDIGGGEWSK